MNKHTFSSNKAHKYFKPAIPFLGPKDSYTKLTIIALAMPTKKKKEKI
jgi:hypothetical protein